MLLREVTGRPRFHVHFEVEETVGVVRGGALCMLRDSTARLEDLALP